MQLYEHDTTRKHWNWISIDPGISNFAISVGWWSLDFTTGETTWCEVSDITVMHQTKSEQRCCTLDHRKNAVSWLDHFFVQWSTLFSQADFIMVENNFQGFTEIECIILARYSNTIIVPAQSMHKTFQIGYHHIKDKELRRKYRKNRVNVIAPLYMNDDCKLMHCGYYNSNHELDLSHHCADSTLIAEHQRRKFAEQYKNEKRTHYRNEKFVKQHGLTFEEKLQEFMFNK